MLAQHFKTPTDLKITDAEFEALLKVLRMLERGELKHSDCCNPTTPHGFNMSVASKSSNCGAVACILGWARIISGEMLFRNIGNDGKDNDALLETFMFVQCSPTYDQSWDRKAVTQDQAAIALRSYLTHGEPRWAEALADRSFNGRE